MTFANKLFRPSLLSAVLLAAVSAGSIRPAAAEALLLIEADSGKVLHAENATMPWYPASVTKLMTAYVTLRAVKERRLTLDSLISVSANAAAQAPSKMGFKPGTQLTVDNAIKMLMVKSANDVAVVLAEGVSGSIAGFAEDMNRAAQRLGMTQTTYVNPNGLPADEQITSARDLAILARALLREFPEYEFYWRLSAIKFGKRVMRNYNTLIDRYPGADGMKTGFICASGFNLVASATRNGKKLIAVVLGAPSGPVRAVKAASLLERGFNSGSLSWLTPSLGNVDSLMPVNAAPPNLREEMCGKKRKRPAAESEDHDDSEQVNASNPTIDPGSAQGFALSTLRTAIAKPSTLIGPLHPSMEPVVVYVGPNKNKGQADTQLAAGAKSKKGVAVAAVGAAAAVAAVPAGQARTGNSQVNAPAFAAAPPAYPSTSTFTPPTGAPGYAAGDIPIPKPRPKLAARSAATAPVASKPAAQMNPKPVAPAKPGAAKPAAQAAAKPVAKPKPQ